MISMQRKATHRKKDFDRLKTCLSFSLWVTDWQHHPKIRIYLKIYTAGITLLRIFVCLTGSLVGALNGTSYLLHSTKTFSTRIKQRSISTTKKKHKGSDLFIA